MTATDFCYLTTEVQNAQICLESQRLSRMPQAETFQRLPTLTEIKSVIPEECFEKNLGLSLFYLVFDYAAIATLYFTVSYFENIGGWFGLGLWYYLVGMFGMSLFVVGHDCGHGTFSDSTWINDLCGHIAHAPLNAPYWPWQKSHRKHHQHTSHAEKDRSHPWVTKEQFSEWNFVQKHFRKIPISGLWDVYTKLGVPDGSHFWPFSPLFTNNKERLQCVVSGAACFFCSYVAWVLCDYSMTQYLKYYQLPVWFFSLWLMVVTFLQHKDEEICAYEDDTWTYVKGQSQTIDRTYGFGVDYLMHHISDGHVAHHYFFTKIPHYHLPQATKAIRPVLEKHGLYRSQSTYDHLFEFLRLNVKLEYMLGAGTGVLKYSVSKDFQKKTG